jgi:hypothetical protein
MANSIAVLANVFIKSQLAAGIAGATLLRLPAFA